MDYKISSDGSTAVSTTQEWLPMEDCPTNTKVRLLTEGRVSVPGSVTLQTLKNYVAWAPEPKEPAWLKEKLKPTKPDIRSGMLAADALGAG